ncbi:MAG TPA: carbamoyl phosphate synthase large subunit [Lentisphaeria bacterium]|nr:MAG: carbamoyl phosphate synthase large subunit [Lentisphaerae bacterium GWF2_38_69]HBM15717.1 carbamoyl phosphate synthase large subunit [Lentisphaeria bacterium]
MPKRTDIKKIMLIGSGPIIIGQACEFDYSGAQACKALKEEGYDLVLVNSNPATIMTDPEFADRTYIEPLTKDILHEIIRRERPDALLPTLGGQTALNLAMELYDSGILNYYRIKMIGAQAEVIRRAEDRQLFKETMKSIGLDVPKSGSAHSMEEATKIAEEIGTYPLIIRPGFTLGGTGGGIAYNPEDFEAIVERGLDASPTTEVLIEESLLGWKEFELEVMRDKKDNAVIVCSIENIDPMGVHTGDSITVAPAQTLTDREYQNMRDASLKVMRAIGVETGGSNVQWAVNPDNGRMVIIEMNPRVSRSSALASKATGFPIAKIAAKLAVGYTLDEINNDITRKTPACFEPSIDYVVTKIPRFAFEKFSNSNTTLNTSMKSVGETMSIGKNFKISLQKALRSLEIGRYGFGADGKDTPYSLKTDEEVKAELIRPNAFRLFYIREAFRRGWPTDTVFELTKIDKWFLRHMHELACFEDEIASAGNIENLKKDYPLFLQAKEFGYSDRQIACILDVQEAEVRQSRKEIGLLPIYNLVDTCAGEFEAFTPYFYSSYGMLDEKMPEKGKKKIMILGGGPNRIGQGIEFDYCCVHACFALRKAGFETIMVNSNPETVSTDYDTSDKLYFEPLTLEDVLNIYERENCYGVIVQFGGQTPLNLAKNLEKNGVKIIGTTPSNIEKAENRNEFRNLLSELNINQPESDTATNEEDAVKVAESLGYPVLVRPSYVLGGRSMMIVYKEKYLRKYMQETIEVTKDKPVLIDRYLDNAVEVDVDCLGDGQEAVIAGIMDHIELAGIHSGDSACMLPSITLDKDVLKTIRENTLSMARALNVIGLMNVQYAIKENKVYVLEVNPRASRTVPFVSKAIGLPVAKIAALLMAGKTLREIGLTKEYIPSHISCKEAVFPFTRFPGADIVLSPEMKSTGEVMGIDFSPGIAFLKSQMAGGTTVPTKGNLFFSLSPQDIARPESVKMAKDLIELGFKIYATPGTSTYLYERGIRTNTVFMIGQGRPNVIDLLKEGEVEWVIITPAAGPSPMVDEIVTRAEAVIRGIPVQTTLSGLAASINGLKFLKGVERLDVCSIQEYHRHAPKLNLSC